MADKEISMLPQVDSINDETKLPVYNPNSLNPAQHATGAQLAAFAREGGAAAMETVGRPLVDAAASSAASAAASAKQAADQMEDARIGYDGTVYETAGEAVRKQIGAFGMVPITFTPGVNRKNLFDKNACTRGSWANYTNGNIETYPDNANIKDYSMSDYIPVVGGESYTFSGGSVTSGYTTFSNYCIYDSAKSYVTGSRGVTNSAEPVTITMPANAAYIVINFGNYQNVDKNVQFERGSVATEYEEYIPGSSEPSISGYSLPNLIVGIGQVEGLSDMAANLDAQQEAVGVLKDKVDAVSEKTDKLNIVSPKRKNLIDLNTLQFNEWAATNTGAIQSNAYTGDYCRTDYIPVTPGGTYVFHSYDATYAATIRSYVYYDTNKKFISGVALTGANTTAVLTVPDNAAYVIINGLKNAFEKAMPQLEEGSEPTQYEEYLLDSELAFYRLPDLRVSMNQIEGSSLPDTETNILRLPDEYHLVVGDTFELFYKGIINAANPDLFDVVITCGKGNAYSKRFIYTPVAGDVGTHTLSVELYDYTRTLVGSGHVNLVVSAKASSPASNINILCVGDSLTTNGDWPKEFRRRLVGLDGTPAGDSLRNITFIGTRQKGDVRYEGYGGGRFSHYNTANVSTNAKVITCTHDKTEADDQHSIYKDSTGAQWKLETIETGNIKIIAVTGEGNNFPATGTLTWVSGGKNHSDIVYTASINGPGNPFWNSDTGMVDFAKYAAGLGASRIDYVYVLLGWNNAGTDEAAYTKDAQTFIDNVHKSFPNCKIILMGLQIPARDGLGNNYGANGIYSRYYELMQHVFRLDRIYATLSENNNNVYSFNLSGQFDTENNSITSTRTVNARNPKVETYQSNGIHPDITGYMQIADACYRDFIHKFQ